MPKSYTDEQRAEAIALAAEIGVSETAARLGINAKTLYNWGAKSAPEKRTEHARQAARARWDSDTPYKPVPRQVLGADVHAVIVAAVEQASDVKLTDEDRVGITRAAKGAEIAKAMAAAKMDELPDRAELARLAMAVVIDMGRRVLADQIKIATAVDAQRLSDCFFNILRLEQGEATSITGNLSREEILAGIADLKERAQERRLSAVPDA